MPYPLPEGDSNITTVRNHPLQQRKEAIWALHQTISRRRSVLLEFYPAALQAFPPLKHRTAVAMLAAAPTPTSGRTLTGRKVVAVLGRSGPRIDPTLVERILRELKTLALRQPAQVEEALGYAVTGLLDVIASMQHSVDSLEDALGREFDSHPLAPILRSAPGLGPILAARVLAEVGDEPARFATANGLRVRWYRADHPSLRSLALRLGTKGPQQTTRRRLPLVGVLDAHQIGWRPSTLRQTTSCWRPPQRRSA